MVRLLAILVVFVVVLLGVRWLSALPAPARGRIVRKGMLLAGGAVLLIAALTGRLNPLLALMGALPLLLPLLRKLLGTALGGVSNSGAGPRSGQQSTVRTRFIDMVLDHDSGELSGTVKEGHYAGRCLAELDLAQLVELLAQCRTSDNESARVLEAYLDRTHQDAWREHVEQTAAEPGPSGTLILEQAREILGVEIGASREDIIAAHRRLMQKLHPDRGGSNYLAAIINEAKTLLLDNA